MDHQYQLVRMSANRKLGGLPATATSADTCPQRCSFRSSGCYAESGPSGINFRALTERRRGTDLDTFCAGIRKLPKHQLYRLNQAGDLPGDGFKIDQVALQKIVSANRGRHGFSYTHYSPYDPDNAKAIRCANSEGLAINLSAETLDEVDRYIALGIAPVVVTLPSDQVKSVTTPGGNTVTVCPASLSDDVTCATCAACSVPERRGAIGFPAHGSGKAHVEKIFWAEKPKPRRALRQLTEEFT